MARYTVVTYTVDVLGKGWYGQTIAMRYTLSAWDREGMPETRDGVQAWLDRHAGDFASVTDFSASLAETEIYWGSAKNEDAFLDIMYPEAGEE